MEELKESVKVKGSVRKQLFSEDGTCVYDQTDHNLVVTVGLAYLASYLVTATPPFMSYIGLGTNGGATDTTASVTFTVTTVTDLTHLVVSSTAGLTATNTISQTTSAGTFNTTITSVTDGTHLVVGSTSGWVASASPASGQTSLQTPLPTYVQGTLSSPSSGVWQNVTTFGPGVNSGAITEAGLFSTSAPGTMFARQIFAVINKGAGNTFVLTWQVTFS